MPAKTGSRNGLSYGWALGENNWSNGMDGNLTFIDRFGVHLSFKSFLNTPSGSPAAGDCYVIDTAPTGAWVGKAGQVAVYDDGAWRYGVPRTGWRAYCEADERPYVYDGGWTPTASEWAATKVTQAEAEEGTGTTDRKWDALRVRQAIAAWWLTASSALGRTLAGIADAAAGRTALGLGTAAVLIAGQSDANLPTNSDLRAYYGVKYKPAVAPTLVIDFENSYFAIYNASTNSLFVADTWDAFATYLGADLTISRAGEQTYFDALGVMRVAAANTLQCDHDPLTGRRLGPYLGPARTNILLASEVPATQSVNVTAQAYALSFYGTGTVTLSGAHTATLVGSGAFPVRSTLTFTPAAGILTLTVSGGVQKFQLEAGADASPYIPTTPSAATRPATTVSIGGTKFTGCYNQTQGTLVMQYNRPVRTPLSSVAMSVGDGTTQNRMYFLTGNTAGTAFDYFEATTAGVGQGSTGSVATTVGRAAFSYATNNLIVGKNGASYIDSTFAVPTVNKLDLGHRDGTSQINGHLTSVTYYPVALSTNPVVELAK